MALAGIHCCMELFSHQDEAYRIDTPLFGCVQQTCAPRFFRVGGEARDDEPVVVLLLS